MTKQLRWGHRIGNKISIAVNKKKESIKVSGNQVELDVMAWANRVDQIGVSYIPREYPPSRANLKRHCTTLPTRNARDARVAPFQHMGNG